MTDIPDRARIEAAAEALYALMPAHIRSSDAANGWALKALFTVLASGGVEIEHEIDALYDSMFVESAPESGLPDLAALIAAEPLHPLPAGSGYNQRSFIGNTMRYRRGKGTARVLEALAADVGGFGAVAVEYFMRLARTQNLIDVRAERPGTAVLVAGDTAARTGTAFDMLPRLVDIRSIARAGGRHHAPHVGVHLLRFETPLYPAPAGTGLPPAELAGVPQARPWAEGSPLVARPGYFQLAAQPGRKLRLFNPNRRDDAPGRIVDPQLPDRLRRLPLHLESEELRKAIVEGRAPRLGDVPWFDGKGQPFTIFLRAKGAAVFERVPPQQIEIANLDSLPTTAAQRPAAAKRYPAPLGGPPVDSLIRCGFDPATGRVIVAQPASPAQEIEEVRVAYAIGTARPLGAGPHNRDGDDVPFDIVDTQQLVNLVWVVDAAAAPGPVVPNVRTVASLAEALTGWSADGGAGKRGFIVLTRCDQEGPSAGAANISVATHPGSELHIVSARWVAKAEKAGLQGNPDRRGYLVRQERRFTIAAPLRITASGPPVAGGSPGALVLDGIELTEGLSLAVRAVSRLRIRHCTVRSPGKVAISTTAPLDDVAIEVDRSVVGRMALEFGSNLGSGSLAVTGSIVSADGAAGAALSATSLDACLNDVTIFGDSSLKSLEASNAIFTGPASVTRSQSGCVRYSSIAEGSAMPRRFRCQPDLALSAAAEAKGAPLDPLEANAARLAVTPLFLDESLDEPTVAMLHPAASDAIRMGGEAESEMGVYSTAAEGLRGANLKSLFDDYVPFGLEAGVIDDTRSSTAATRRSRP